MPVDPRLPGLTPRHAAVRVQGLGRKGERLDLVAKDFFARVLQHETDHLNGRVYLDRMPDLGTLSFLTEWSRYWLTPDGRGEGGVTQPGPVGTAGAVALTRDLLFGSRIRETARQLGFPFRRPATLADLPGAARGAGRPPAGRSGGREPGQLSAALDAVAAARSRHPVWPGPATSCGRPPGPSTTGATAW